LFEKIRMRVDVEYTLAHNLPHANPLTDRTMNARLAVLDPDDAQDFAADELRSELDAKPFRDAVLELVSGLNWSQQIDFFALIRTACDRLAQRAALGAMAQAQADRAADRAFYNSYR
jgi:hypothetical protein